MERIKETSTGDARIDAASYIRLMEDSQFVVALVVGQFVLSFLARVTVVQYFKVKIVIKSMHILMLHLPKNV